MYQVVAGALILVTVVGFLLTWRAADRPSYSVSDRYLLRYVVAVSAVAMICQEIGFFYLGIYSLGLVPYVLYGWICLVAIGSLIYLAIELGRVVGRWSRRDS